jgi:hypothetical protein
VEQLEGQDVPEFEKRWSRYARPVNSSWRCDEVLQPLSRPATEKKNSMSAAVFAAHQPVWCFLPACIGQSSQLFDRSLNNG